MMSRCRLALVVLLACVLIPVQAPAQVAPATRAAETSTDPGMRVFLITFGDGDAVWEKFGHSAIWIQYPSALPNYVDLAYNWGMFDDRAASFYFHFLQGRLWYWMQSDPAVPLMDFYAKELDRTVIVQELNLTL